MAFGDLLTVLAVFAIFGFLILARINKRSPGAIRKLKNFFRSEKPKVPDVVEATQQVWQERRVSL